MKGLLEIICQASEFDQLPIRRKEAGVLRKLAAHLPLKIESQKWNDPHVKANVLLQSHFSRRQITSDLADDQKLVVESTARLLQAAVDVISASGWLTPALAAMELSQMCTQAVWDSDPVLKQLPHVTDEALKRFAELKVETIFDLMEMADDKRRAALGALTTRQLSDVARVCNQYPNIEVSYQVAGGGTLPVGGSGSVLVELQRDGVTDDKLTHVMVHAPHYPRPKVEGWWLVLGHVPSNHLLAVKRVALGKSARVKLDFELPAELAAGTPDLSPFVAVPSSDRCWFCRCA
jgi:pre-mRNA-splicing helicase BRR2